MFLYGGYVDVEFVGAAFCEGIQLRKGGVDLLPGVLCFLEMERERQLAELVGEVGTRAHTVRVQCGRGSVYGGKRYTKKTRHRWMKR